MFKDIYVKKGNGTTLRLGELQAPIQRKAMELDCSLSWLVCDMLKSHPYLKEFLEEKNVHRDAEILFLKEFNKLHYIMTFPRNKYFSEEEKAFIKEFANKLDKFKRIKNESKANSNNKI